jgi:hypothetical protein
MRSKGVSIYSDQVTDLRRHPAPPAAGGDFQATGTHVGLVTFHLGVGGLNLRRDVPTQDRRG